MWTTFRYYLGRSRGQILGWGLALAVLGGYINQFYDTIAKPGMREQLEQLFRSYPPELMAFFGDTVDMFSPSGYLDVEFFSYMPIILGIYAVLVGSGLLSGDEESGTLDLILAHPLSRARLYFGRLAAFMAATLLILALAAAGFLVVLPGTDLDLTAGELLLPFISLFGVLALFGTLSVLLSQVLPSRRAAAMTASLVLIACFFINFLARLDEDLKPIAKYLPLKYYQGGKAIDGLEWGWLGGMLAIALLFALLAWWQFERRDIRVGGEGGWNLPKLLALRARKAGST